MAKRISVPPIDMFKSYKSNYQLVQMTEEIQHIKKQIEKEMKRLRNLYSELESLERKRSEPEELRVKRLEMQLKKKYPDIKIDRSLLRLVGTLPRNPRSKDKEVIRAIIAERYAKR